MTDDVRENGFLVHVKGDLGYAFVRPDEGGPDLFAHRSEFDREDWGNIAMGDRVSFQIGPSKSNKHDGKMCAKDVKRIF